MFDPLSLMPMFTNKNSPKYRAQLEHMNTYYDKIEAAISYDFLDEFLQEQSKLTDLELEDFFLHALRLGAQMALSLVRDPNMP